jgi:hypothetical protein
MERPVKTKKGDSGGSGMLPNVVAAPSRAETQISSYAKVKRSDLIVSDTIQRAKREAS